MTMISDLVTNQVRVLSFVQGFVDEFGYSPSQIEISRALGISRKAVVNNLDRLGKNGLVSKEYAVDRSLSVPGQAQFNRLPVCGWAKKSPSWGQVVSSYDLPVKLAPKDRSIILSRPPEYFITENVIKNDLLIIDIVPSCGPGVFVLWSEKFGKVLERLDDPGQVSTRLVLGKMINVVRTFE